MNVHQVNGKNLFYFVIFGAAVANTVWEQHGNLAAVYSLSSCPASTGIELEMQGGISTSVSLCKPAGFNSLFEPFTSCLYSLPWWQLSKFHCPLCKVFLFIYFKCEDGLVSPNVSPSLVCQYSNLYLADSS